VLIRLGDFDQVTIRFEQMLGFTTIVLSLSLEYKLQVIQIFLCLEQVFKALVEIRFDL
jgi:hypothetical protein